MKYRILKLILAIWIMLWLAFTIRGLIKKGNFYDYKILLSRPLEGKRSYVTGDRFYTFLLFCNKNLPRGAGYGWIGIEEGSLDKRRAAYYLYPHLEKTDGAEFILVYDKPNMIIGGYEIFAKLDEARYILKKKGDNWSRSD